MSSPEVCGPARGLTDEAGPVEREVRPHLHVASRVTLRLLPRRERASQETRCDTTVETCPIGRGEPARTARAAAAQTSKSRLEPFARWLRKQRPRRATLRRQARDGQITCSKRNPSPFPLRCSRGEANEWLSYRR